MTVELPRSDAPLLSRDGLADAFRAAEKPVAVWRIGAEAEKFGVLASSGVPICYDGERGVLRVLASLREWKAHSEFPGGPTISLRREGASVTLEPGAQLELSGAPLDNVHEIRDELIAHMEDLSEISGELGLAWLGIGFHPFAKSEDLPWVPKQRYAIMKRYLPTQGRRAVDMMQRTATVQANFDYSCERDAMRKLSVMLRLSPAIAAMTANAPWYEGRRSEFLSERADVWVHMDPARSGLVPQVWARAEPSYDDYVDWALDAGMFFFVRDGQPVKNTGQRFRAFLRDGFEGHRATWGDWVAHLQTLFPEARLKNTLEVRCCDAQLPELAYAVPALLTGLLYDSVALDRAHELALSVDLESAERARPQIPRLALRTELGGRKLQELALAILEIAEGGLQRRARLDQNGRDERTYLAPLRELTERGRSPAEWLLESVPGDVPDVRAVIERTRFRSARS